MALTAPYTGRRVGVGFSKEGTRGTTAASADYWIPYAAYSFYEKVAKVKDESGISKIEKPISADIVKKWTEGDIEFNVRDQSIGLILLSLFGTETFQTNIPQSGVGTHTFTVATSNQHQSLSVWRKSPVITQQAGNVMITSFQLRAVLDQYLRATVGLIGKIFGTDTGTVSYVSENRFRPQDAVIKLAATYNELSGASSIGTIRALEMSFSKNVEDYQGLGDVNPADFVNKDMQVSGNFEIVLENNTYTNMTLLNQFKAMSVKFANTGIIIGTSTNPSLEIILDEVDFDPFDIEEANENVSILRVNFTGHYNQTNSRMAQAILINGKNAAY